MNTHPESPTAVTHPVEPTPDLPPPAQPASPADCNLPVLAAAPTPPATFPSPLRQRPRTGAVAQLPKAERDMVSRMVAQRVPYKTIASAVETAGFHVTERNISNWVTRGGYLEWSLHQEQALQNRLRQEDLLAYHRPDDSADLAEVGLQSAATRLSEFVLQQTGPDQDLEQNFAKVNSATNLLCRINHQLFTVQKHRDHCARLIHRTPARLKFERQTYLKQIEDIWSEPASPRPAQLGDSLSPAALPPAPDPNAAAVPIAASAPPPDPKQIAATENQNSPNTENPSAPGTASVTSGNLQ